MKKIYNKPLITVEVMSLDSSIATAVNCTANKFVVESLVEMGYFSQDRGCDFYLLPNGGVDENFDGVADSYDTVCYNSNVQTAFYS